MTDTKPRRSSSGVVYWIEQPTTHYRRVANGRFYRDTWVRLADGSRQLWAVPA